MFRIRGLLSADQLNELDRLMEAGRFIDGRASAGVAGQSIKANFEMDHTDQNSVEANKLVQQALRQNGEFIDYAMPFKISGILFSRYTAGMMYGDHIDNVVNWGPQLVIRNDLSFTIFLSSPDEFQGGELNINFLNQENAAKYDRGDMVIYPSGLVHRVNEVTEGRRKAAVGFVQSLIPQQDQREIVHRVRKARNETLERDGRSEQFKSLEYVLTNLQRMWMQV